MVDRQGPANIARLVKNQANPPAEANGGILDAALIELGNEGALLVADYELLEMQRQAYLRQEAPDFVRIKAAESRQSEIRANLRQLLDLRAPPCAAE